MTPLGFVVAGGRSTRMGRDKARLPYGGGTLLEHAIATLRAVTDDVRILCGPTRRYEGLGVPVVTDEICGAGPISGLHAALITAAAEGQDRLIWLGVDLPLIPASFLGDTLAALEQADAAMARTESGPEPLCAAFRTGPTLVGVRRALLDGRLKLTAALEGLRRFDVDAPPGFFANVNAPGDYEALGTGRLPSTDPGTKPQGGS